MSTITQTPLELAVTVAWHLWGDGYALYTVCNGCGEMHYCRGRVRCFVLCVGCFDQKGVKP